MTAAVLDLARYRRPHLRGRDLVYRETCIKLCLAKLGVFYDMLCDARQWGGDHVGAGLLVSAGESGVTISGWELDRCLMTFPEFDALVAEVELELATAGGWGG